MKKMYENKSNSPMYVGSTMVPPGEMVMVEVADEPLAPATAAEPTLAELVAKALKNSAKDLIAGLPNVSDDMLAMALQLEGAADKPRVTLLAAIGAEQLARANTALLAEKADERAQLLESAQADLAAAQTALDVEGDTHKHPELEAAVSAAKVRVEALTAPQD